ncbi:MAG: ATP-binding protein [Candidatus Hodarchaeaceae archaeon]|nr:ATP-binding protein [Candidatus Hodarchaeaceae archaeon]
MLKEFSMEVGRFFGDIGVSLAGLPDWVMLFKYLREKVGGKRVPVVVDEFPFLAGANRAMPSLFQRGWDEHLRHTNVFLILCGSSISMMEKGVPSYRSPLYGRRTGQLFFQPLKFNDARKFFPRKGLGEQMEFYAVLGGTPAYLLQFSEEKDLIENIRERVLRRDAFLYNEVEFVLRGELKEPRKYFTILKEIAFGRTKLNDISRATGVERGILSRYLSILEDLRVIRRSVPVTEKHPHKSRKGVYEIEDNFFKFWFEFVFPNRSYIEGGEPELVIKKIIEGLDAYLGRVFEEVCSEALWWMLKLGRAPFTFTELGKWWSREDEVDIVALNERTKEVLSRSASGRKSPSAWMWSRTCSRSGMRWTGRGKGGRSTSPFSRGRALKDPARGVARKMGFWRWT